MSLSVAFRAFFATLFDAKASARVDAALKNQDLIDAVPKTDGAPKKIENVPATKPIAAVASGRSDSLTLLSSLQREARLLDLVYESLDGYSDAQIGAAARDVLRDSRKTLDRLFAIERLTNVDEGASVELPENASPARWRIVGSTNHRKGTLTHAGWTSTKVDLPKWTGKQEDAPVIAPAEVETAP